MARPTLFGHRKFRALARQLQSKALAVGTLELIWAVANDSGDAFLGSSEDVEDVADWRGEPGALTGLLVSCGFLDASGDGFLVHDHEHHCPQYVRRRRDREQKRRGTDASLAGQRHVSDVPLSSTPNSHLPSPITQHPKEKKPSPSAPGFDEFWDAYPRRIAKGAALKAWKKQAPSLGLVLAALERQRGQWTDPKFIPYPASWLNAQRWLDEPEVVAVEREKWWQECERVGHSPRCANLQWHEVQMAKQGAA